MPHETAGQTRGGDTRGAQTGSGSLEALEIIAYELEPGTGLTLEPAAHERDWMLATGHGFANRCLPLLIANQSGWIIRNNATVHLTWSGGRGRGPAHALAPNQ